MSYGYLLSSRYCPQTSLHGEAFDAFIINQSRTQLEYSLKQYQRSFLKTKDSAEIDLIIFERGRIGALNPVSLRTYKSISKPRNLKH